MLRFVLNDKAIPQPTAHLFAETIHQRLSGMGAQVAYDQMDSDGSGMVLGNLQYKLAFTAGVDCP